MLRECIYGECAHKQHVRRTLTRTHAITAYSVSENVVCVCTVWAYSSVQLDKSRVEKEFTADSQPLYQQNIRQIFTASSLKDVLDSVQLEFLQRSQKHGLTLV